MVGRRRRHRALALQFAAPIGRDRSDRIVLAIGAPQGAIEDVVGRDLDDGDAERGGGFCHFAGGCAVSQPCSVLLAFGQIDGGEGSGIDDDVGPAGCDGRRDRLQPFEVQLRAPERVHGHAFGRAFQHRKNDLA